MSPAFFEVVYDARRYAVPGRGFYAGFALVALTGIVLASRRLGLALAREAPVSEADPSVGATGGCVFS